MSFYCEACEGRGEAAEAEVERLRLANSTAAMLLREYEADAHPEDVGNVTRWLAVYDKRESGK